MRWVEWCLPSKGQTDSRCTNDSGSCTKLSHEKGLVSHGDLVLFGSEEVLGVGQERVRVPETQAAAKSVKTGQREQGWGRSTRGVQ